MSIERAEALAKQTILQIPGVVGVGRSNNALIVYVESAEVERNVPKMLLGHPVIVKVVGRVSPL